MKGSPAVPGGPLTSKPTWPSTRKVLGHVGFFSFTSRQRAVATAKEGRNGQVECDGGAADRPGGQRFRAAGDGARAHVGDRGPEWRDAGGHAARGPVAG